MRRIKVLFWNLHKKNLISPLIELMQENNLDIITLAEAKELDISSVLDSFKTIGEEWNDIQVDSINDIRVLAKKEIKIVPYKEEKHYSLYKIKKDGCVNCLLAVIHLISKMNKSNDAQYNRASNISRELCKYEQEIFGENERRTIIIGDFNMQPYESGICSGYSFNATMSSHQASKVTRKIDGEMVYFYYNPMWALMGANKLVQGSYYSSTDNDDNAIYWYSFDSVLLRPYYIDKFNWDYFAIIEETKNHKFVPNTTIDKLRYSDHLPIKFEILGG